MAVRRMLEQKRAAAAWQCMTQVLGADQDTKEEYRALVRRFPAMMRLSGLGPACAFLYAKSGDGGTQGEARPAPAGGQAKPPGPHKLLLDHLGAWLRSNLAWGQGDLVTWLRSETVSDADYRRATAEALAYLLWLVRFAEGALPAPEAGDGARAQGATD